MAFEVELTEPAELDLHETLAYLAKDSHAAAAKWNSEFWDIVFSLREMPQRFALIQEAPELGLPLRCTHLYAHRIIFRIDDNLKTVFVVRVYHGSRRPLSAHDLPV